MEKLTKVLRNLDLSDNKLPAVPPSIGNFQMLKYLSLNNNRLGEKIRFFLLSFSATKIWVNSEPETVQQRKKNIVAA